jgi:hypothetical protein
MGWGRVQAICDFVHNHISFGYEHASATRTARFITAVLRPAKRPSGKEIVPILRRLLRQRRQYELRRALFGVVTGAAMHFQILNIARHGVGNGQGAGRAQLVAGRQRHIHGVGIAQKAVAGVVG